MVAGYIRVLVAERIATFENHGRSAANNLCRRRFASALNSDQGTCPELLGVEEKQLFKAVLEDDAKLGSCHGETRLAPSYNGQPRWHDHALVLLRSSSRTGLLLRDTRGSSGGTRNPYTSRCSNSALILRTNNFKTYIVSGCGIELMRPGRRRCTVSRPSTWLAAGSR